MNNPKTSYIKLINCYLPSLSETDLFKVLTLVKNTTEKLTVSASVESPISDEELKNRLVKELPNHLILADKIATVLGKRGLSVSTSKYTDHPNTVNVDFGEYHWEARLCIDLIDGEEKFNLSWRFVNRGLKLRQTQTTIVDEVTNFCNFIEWLDDFMSKNSSS